jgi:hypothetical protein
VIKQRRFVWISAAATVAALLAAAAVWAGAHYDAMLLLGSLTAAGDHSRLERTTPEPLRTPVAYSIAGRRAEADLYLPGAGAAQAGIVLVPGAEREGKRDERLVALARSLARLRFAVLVPELHFSQELRIEPSQICDVADAFGYLVQRGDLAPGGRAGIAAFSYAVGPAVLAALGEGRRRQVRFIVGVGGYYDLHAAIRFSTTGYFELAGEPRYLVPDPYPVLVLARTLSADVRNPADRRVLDAMIEARLADRQADIAPLARRLGPEGKAVYDLVTNRDPERTRRLIAALPAASRATIEALSLRNRDLVRLSARLILVHGRDDRFIPFVETLALARAAPPGRVHVFILRRVLGHVDLDLASVLSTRFWSVDLRDALDLVRAMSLLLQERRMPPADPGLSASAF